MEEFGACNQGMFIDPKVEEEDFKDDDDEEDFKIKTLLIRKCKRRWKPSLNQLEEMKKEPLDGELGQIVMKCKTKKHQCRDRWPAERYQQAQQSLWELLRAAGANFANPISRTALRKAARQHIGDTGLLDHLLKEIDGKIAPVGTDRFRRCHNPTGIMEYWLETAHLDKVSHEAGLLDPYWLPPNSRDTSCELMLLQIEMAKIKRDMQELILKKQEKNEHNLMEVTQKEFVKLKATTEKSITGIVNSVKSMQDMCAELITFKTKVDQQLADIASRLNDLQRPREQIPTTPTGFPSEEWEGWLENFDPDNIPGDGFAAWLDCTEPLDIQEIHHNPILALPSPPGNKKLNDARSLLDIATKRQKEDQTDVTPCSSMTVSPKSDLDNNSFIVFQGMLLELFKWKDKMEQQLLEVSNSVHMLKMK